MTVQDLMTKPVVTCHPENNLAEASALMWENDCGALPVVNNKGEVKGIITDRDLCIALGTRNIRSADLTVGDVLREDILECKSSDDVHVALTRMSEGKVRRLPVMDDQSRLAGILSIDDIVLNVSSNGRVGSSVSYRDAVTALQAIYRRPNSVGGPAALIRTSDVAAEQLPSGVVQQLTVAEPLRN